VLHDHVGKGVLKEGLSVQRRGPFELGDPHPLGQLCVFDVDFREGFDVIAGEGDADDECCLIPSRPYFGATSA
jgi:hypothetical protein